MGVLIQLTTHQHITITSTIMAIRIIMAISTFVSCMEIPQDLYEIEKDAFKMCESDRMIGLTWREVEKCEERFGDILEKEGIRLPGKEDFDYADLDGDGTLFFEEWEEFMESQPSEEDDSSED